MPYTFDPNPPLSTDPFIELKKRREQAELAAFMKATATQPEPDPGPRNAAIMSGSAANSQDIAAKAMQAAMQQTQEANRGKATATLLSSKADMAAAANPPPVVVAGNATNAKPFVVAPNNAKPTQASDALTPERATTFYGAVQQMDPLGQAVMAHMLGVDARVFKRPEEQALEQTGLKNALDWQKSMDDPQSPQRQALESGDLEGFTKMATAAGALTPQQGIDTLRSITDPESKRESWMHTIDAYQQAGVFLNAASTTLTDSRLASEGGIDKDGSIRVFDIGKLMKKPGAVDDVVRAVQTTSDEDPMGARDTRPYIQSANLHFFDQISGFLSNYMHVDEATKTAKFEDLTWGNEESKTMHDNLLSYINHERVSLVASGRQSPEAVKAMDDMEVLSMVTGSPRLAAILDADNNVLLGNAKTILQQQTMFAPKGYSKLMGETMQTQPGDGGSADAGKAPSKGKK